MEKKVDIALSMGKEDIEQQRGKIDIVEQRGKSRHCAAAWYK